MIIEDLIFPYDYIVLTLICFVVIFCFWKGFIQSLLGLLTWVGSILITIYTYNTLADFLTNQLTNISFFQNYEYLTNIISIIISIPILFLISLFILKKIRKFLSDDLDKQILGKIFDKIFGFIYGIVFSYVILSTIIILLERFEYNELNSWLNNNSNIIYKISNFNQNHLYLTNSVEEIS